MTDSLIQKLEGLRLTVWNMGYVGMLTGEHRAQNRMLDKCIKVIRLEQEKKK